MEHARSTVVIGFGSVRGWRRTSKNRFRSLTPVVIPIGSGRSWLRILYRVFLICTSAVIAHGALYVRGVYRGASAHIISHRDLSRSYDLLASMG